MLEKTETITVRGVTFTLPLASEFVNKIKPTYRVDGYSKDGRVVCNRTFIHISATDDAPARFELLSDQSIPMAGIFF